MKQYDDSIQKCFQAVCFCLALLGCGLLSGCSVGMAISGSEDPQLGAIRVGATRGEVELHLGPPAEISHQNGYRVDVYEYELGNKPSAGRAIGHGVMDLLTLGLWEAVGTPIEGFQGDKKRLIVVYDDYDVVTRVGSLPPPQPRTPENQSATLQPAVAAPSQPAKVLEPSLPEQAGQ